MALYNPFIFPEDFEIPSTKHSLCQILELNSSEEMKLTVIWETGYFIQAWRRRALKNNSQNY